MFIVTRRRLASSTTSPSAGEGSGLELSLCGSAPCSDGLGSAARGVGASSGGRGSAWCGLRVRRWLRARFDAERGMPPAPPTLARRGALALPLRLLFLDGIAAAQKRAGEQTKYKLMLTNQTLKTWQLVRKKNLTSPRLLFSV